LLHQKKRVKNANLKRELHFLKLQNDLNNRQTCYSFNSILSSEPEEIPAIENQFNLIELDCGGFKMPLYRDLVKDFLELSSTTPLENIEKIKTVSTTDEPMLNIVSTMSSAKPVSHSTIPKSITPLAFISNHIIAEPNKVKKTKSKPNHEQLPVKTKNPRACNNTLFNKK
jgi:hypothetical protein